MPINRKSFRFRKTLFILLAFSFNMTDAVYARVSATCDLAAATASKEYDVPLSVLRAVTRTETGRTKDGNLEPWPWALNASGQGFWFENKSSAVNDAQRRIDSGLTNVDIGCFQLNFRWHGHAFASISEMFDPQKNARYAAQFLAQLYAEKGNWIRAVGAYHSRTQEHATRYKKKFSEVHANLVSGDMSESHAVPANENQFPLLQHSNSRPSLGSLVPLGDATSRRALIQRTGEI